MEPMPTSRYDHSCGLVTDAERGPEVVVIGGYYANYYLDSVDIYEVNTDSWRPGNESKIKCNKSGTLNNLICLIHR